jgi:membrane protease YdiL (CAAX protease family)
MRSGTASGLQIAFLSFAVLLLAVPLSGYVGQVIGHSQEERDAIGRTLPLLVGAVILIAFPGLRRQVAVHLGKPIPANRGLELTLVVIGNVMLAFAFAGAFVLWSWHVGGSAAVARLMTNPPADAQLAKALTPINMFMMLVAGGVIAPVMEEIVFRGFLYGAWERRWGWLISMFMSSALFALYHQTFWAAFTSGILLTCLYRRTGTLRASILAHSTYNLMLWYPLVGQYVFSNDGGELGDLRTWCAQLACLLLAVIVLPIYLWVARHPNQDAALNEPLPSRN